MHVRDHSGHGPAHGLLAQSQAQHTGQNSESPRMLFPTGGGGDDPFSGSPDERAASTDNLPTAEDMEETPDAVRWEQRLEKIEAAQERIEGLLERIAQDLRK